MSIFRYRGYLPHLESQNSTYFVTFRLSGSIPRERMEAWKFERFDILAEAARQNRVLSGYEKKKLAYLVSGKIEQYLDQLHGDYWLKRRDIACLVVDALKYFDGSRYRLHAWCVMPNHVHIVFTVLSTGSEHDSDLIPVVHSWKSYTAHRANRILCRKGAFWQDWPWSGCSEKIRELLI